jgi:wyosine [tRNA(Phe)-imidazoG37] synthetase (radical SAM superfamily)
MQFILHTNGLLCDEKSCKDLGIIDKIYSVLVSINAASKDTYEDIMRGGVWETLIRNIEWLTYMKKQKKIKKLFFSFIVQRKNFKEMRDFIYFARKYDADVRFTHRYAVANTAGWTDDISIFNSDCKEFIDYVKILQDPIFRNKGCYLDPEAFKLTKIKNINLFIAKIKIQNGYKKIIKKFPSRIQEYFK